MAERQTVSYGDFRYELDPHWAKLPEWWSFTLCSDVAVDSQDRVWVFSRGVHPVSTWSTDGAFLGSWGEGDFRDPHGIYIDRDDAVWLADDQLHIVQKFGADGTLLLELGTRGWANATVSHTGHNGVPFNMPTGMAIDASGDVLVSDGYGNRRVHRFSATGELKGSFGRSGVGPGEFAIVHNLSIDPRGRILVCDRENDRIQVFDPDGAYMTAWTDLVGPADLSIGRDGLVYVAEQGSPLNTEPKGVSILTLDGELVGRWRDVVVSPHGIWTDSAGAIYVADLLGEQVVKFGRI